VAVSLVPIALELLVSLERPMFIERYLAMSVPGLALVIASAVELVPLRLARVAALAVIVALSLRSVGDVYTAPQEQWRSAVAMVAAEAEPGDAVIVYPGYARLPFDYYTSPQLNFRDIKPDFPEIGWGQYFPASGPSLEMSLSDASRTGRVWVVYRSSDPVASSDARLLASFLSCGKTQSENTFQWVKVVLVDFPSTCGVTS
jgi:hypothetical protein